MVTAIICTHNNREIIDACLQSLLHQSYRSWTAIIVDDASTDGTPDYIESHYPSIRVIKNSTNHGPSWGRNDAAALATTPYLAFFDSDIELDSHWLEHVISKIESDESLGVVGGKLYYAGRPDHLHAFGGDLSRLGIGWNRYDGSHDLDLDVEQSCLWVSSAACLMKRDVFVRAGGFDSDFFYGYEDSDIGWRISLLGYRNICIPQARALHRVSESVDRLGDRIVFHFHKNRLRSLLRNYGLFSLLRNIPLYLAYTGADLLLRGQRRVKFRALSWNARNISRTITLRRKTQTSRVVTDKSLTPLFSRRLLPRKTLKARRAVGTHSELA